MGDLKLQASNLVFYVEHRTFGEDGGPALRVVSDVDSQSIQLLRFDCFHKDPHYHYAPDDKNEMWHLDKVVVPDTVGWTIEQVRHRLDAMIAAAGYQNVADKTDMALVQATVDAIEQAMRTP